VKSSLINTKFTINVELLDKKIQEASEHFVSMESECINDVCIDKYLEAVVSYLLVSNGNIIQVITNLDEEK